MSKLKEEEIRNILATIDRTKEPERARYLEGLLTPEGQLLIESLGDKALQGYTFETVEILIKPTGAAFQNPYRITFESPIPSLHSVRVARVIARLLQEEFLAEGIRNVKWKE